MWTKLVPITITKRSAKKGKTFSALLSRKMGVAPACGQFISCPKTKTPGHFRMDNAIAKPFQGELSSSRHTGTGTCEGDDSETSQHRKENKQFNPGQPVWKEERRVQ
jgi:hypothetical protein